MSLADPLVSDTARRVFERHCPLPVAQGATADRLVADLWHAVCIAGLTLALVDDPDGRVTSTGPLASASAVARAAGYSAAPIPLVEAMIAQRLVAESGWADDEPDESVSIAYVATPGNEHDRVMRHV